MLAEAELVHGCSLHYAEGTSPLPAEWDVARSSDGVCYGRSQRFVQFGSVDWASIHSELVVLCFRVRIGLVVNWMGRSYK
jgi:hypothetical protein